MSLTTNLSRAVRLTLLSAAAAAVAVPVVASAQDTSGAVLEEVTVTGSRIAKRDNVAESPIVTVDAGTITESGFVAVEQFLNTLPQIVPGLSSQSNNPSSNGRAFIDLRGLGTNRNLVLIDGRRGMGSTAGGVVDVNTIPTALIERVELITGGAGATYGPDAVAGVVNFIMKRDFDGFMVNGQYGITEQNDGQEWTTDVTLGGNFADGRGNAVFSASYYQRDVMFKDARQFSAQASTTTTIFPGGSWVPPATNLPTQTAVDAIFGPNRCNSNGGQAGFGFNPNGTLFCTGVEGGAVQRDVVGYTGPQSDIATRFFPDFFSYNFEPENILVLPMERWNVYGHVELETSKHFNPYLTATFTNYNAQSQLAPTPAGGSTGFDIPVTNPFIPAQLSALLASRANPTAPFNMAKRFNTLGGRSSQNENNVWQLVAGTKGDIAASWKYDVYASFGRSQQDEIQGGNVRLDRVRELVAAPGGGTGLCAGGLNLFGNAPISDACRARISLQAKNLTIVTQNIVEAVVTGDLFELPAGPVQTAIGAGWRELDFDFKPDGGLQPGIVAGFNEQLPVAGKLDYTDVFGEFEIPLLKDLPAVRELSLNLGIRSTDANITGSDLTYKGSLSWRPTDFLLVRGGYQRAVRAPNVAELFSPQTNNFPTATASDPCNTTGTIAATYRNGPNGARVQALCAAQSASAGTATFVQPSSQFTAIGGGNPNLQPEKAYSYTVGLVLNSPWTTPALERLSLTIDWFDITLEERIASVEAVTIVQRCFNRDGANPTFDINNSWCQLFRRDPNSGGVVGLQQFSRNQATTQVTGIDLAVNYGIGLGAAGDLAWQLQTSYTSKWAEQTTSVDPINDFAGSIGSATAQSFPTWRGQLQTTYTWQDLQVGVTTRYIDSMINRQVVFGSSPVTNTGTPDTWYFDLSARYNVMENFTVRLTVNNLGNQQPRLYSPNVQANTDPSLYDVLGRRYTLGFQVRL